MAQKETSPATTAKGRTKLAGSTLRPLAVIGIAVAAISPTTSVFLVYGDGLSLAGTGIVWAFVAGGIIALAMALCYAEVGSVFPSAGGAYTIVRRALGPVFGGMTTILFLVLGLVATSSILVSAATFLSSLIPGGLPANWVAFAMMVIITILCLERIGPTGWVTTAMLAIELLVILVFIGFAFAHPSGHYGLFSDLVVPTGHGMLAPLAVGGMLAAIVPALFAFNGYDWPLYFAEEATNARRVLPRAVVLAGIISVVVEIAAVIAATLSIKDLAHVAASASPLTVVAQNVMGGVGSKILIAGVVVAMFDTGLAGNLGYARIYYAAGRDRMWPGPVNRFFGHIGTRSQVPTAGFLVLFVGNAVFCIFTSLQTLITFTGVIIAVVYLLVACSALVNRIRDKNLLRTLRMPIWPLPPIIAILGVILALTQQSLGDLIVAIGLAIVSFIVYLAVRKHLPGRLERADSDTGPGWESAQPAKGMTP